MLSKNNSELLIPKCPNRDDCDDFKNGICQFMHKKEEVKNDGSVWRDKRP
jgi:hypothetical protein